MTALSLLIFGLASCKSISSLMQDTISIKETIQYREQIEKAENPAKKMLLTRELSDKKIELGVLKVKDVIPSSNIDYDFCVVADQQCEKGPVEIYIYSRNIRTIAKLEKGVTLIEVTGRFGRFFSMLDEYYTKVEIVQARIDIEDSYEENNREERAEEENVQPKEEDK